MQETKFWVSMVAKMHFIKSVHEFQRKITQKKWRIEVELPEDPSDKSRGQHRR